MRPNAKAIENYGLLVKAASPNREAAFLIKTHAEYAEHCTLSWKTMNRSIGDQLNIEPTAHGLRIFSQRLYFGGMSAIGRL